MSQFSIHAERRSQQRSVPPIIVDWLLAYGNHVPAGSGTEIIFLDKRGRRNLQRDVGSWVYAKLEPKLNAYAIVSDDGGIVTVGYRTKRVNRY